MAKYVWTEGKLVITLDDAEGAAPDLTFDPASCNDATRKAAECFGFQTALRNATAGKMDDLTVARKDLLARAKVFTDIGWKSESEGATKVELSDAEKLDIIGRVMIINKRAADPKVKDKTDAEITAIFNALSDEMKATVLASIAKPIEKAMKQALRDKRAAAKTKMADF